MPELNNFMINNFKIFEGEHWFSFKDLNVFTGANNSGKSTIIKAINLFSNGIATGDFPVLNLLNPNNNVGDFESLVNNESDAKSFKIGFETQIANIQMPFKVVYSFENGETSDFDKQKGKALFSSLEVIDNNGEVFFGIYKTDLYKVNEKNIEFEFDLADSYVIKRLAHYKDEDKIIQKLELPFKSPFEIQGNPGVVFFKLNLKLLEKYISQIAVEDFSSMINHLKSINGEFDYWCGECFNEGAYYLIECDISQLTFRDFLDDLIRDDYYNIAKYELRHSLLFDDDTEDKIKKYNDILKNTDYSEFIKKVIIPILESVDSGLKVFRQKNVLHIGFQNFDERLIIGESQFEYLQMVYNINEDRKFLQFTHESLMIFGIDGIIGIRSHLNTAFEINLITGISETQKKEESKVKESNKFAFSDKYNFELFKDNPKVNIADLGKGTANLIGLILKVASILFSYQKEKKQKQELPKAQGLRPKEIIKKTILIEEPEVFLHPDWQSRLTDFFIYCLKRNDVKLIIETHSVYLIQRLQLLIARKEFESTKVNILYFNSNNEKEKFYKLNVRDDGILKESFGSGFYDEIAILTAEILNAQNLN
ncbi:MAG: AAA family ATPase [Bacteroidales bacterium]|nr:AAA family ATPase [Bacteroidales bacterium]